MSNEVANLHVFKLQSVEGRISAITDVLSVLSDYCQVHYDNNEIHQIEVLITSLRCRSIEASNELKQISDDFVATYCI